MVNDPVVETLFFDGCPNHAARELVETVSAELGVPPYGRFVSVETPDDACGSSARPRFA